MTEVTGSNSSAVKERIAELRRRIRANKGIAHRAWETRRDLMRKFEEADHAVREDQRAIEALGGRVRR